MHSFCRCFDFLVAAVLSFIRTVVPARHFFRVRAVALSGPVRVAIGPPPPRPQFGFGLCWQVFLGRNFLNWVPLLPRSFGGARNENFYLSNCLKNLLKHWKIHKKSGTKMCMILSWYNQIQNNKENSKKIRSRMIWPLCLLFSKPNIYPFVANPQVTFSAAFI